MHRKVKEITSAEDSSPLCSLSPKRKLQEENQHCCVIKSRQSLPRLLFFKGLIIFFLQTFFHQPSSGERLGIPPDGNLNCLSSAMTSWQGGSKVRLGLSWPSVLDWVCQKSTPSSPLRAAFRQACTPTGTETVSVTPVELDRCWMWQIFFAALCLSVHLDGLALFPLCFHYAAYTSSSLVNFFILGSVGSAKKTCMNLILRFAVKMKGNKVS